ncbi:ephrin-B2-like [Centroberyx gerrardi]|uniref:ephrin-B2-like n=1 Tax=Centroberyx gerrardi TaxID=166262 RepID=UPI003AB0867A
MGRNTWSYSAVILLAIICSCRAIILESVYWNSSNTKFTPGQGLVLFPQIGDKMDIVCPRAEASSGGKEEFYRVYLVTRSQMERCAIDKTDTPLLNCDKPHRDVKFTFKFQEFSPNLWGLEFLKGRDYYITSTSTSSLQGLDNTNGGVCRTKSMKLVLRVGQKTGQTTPGGSDPDLLIWVVSGCVILVLVIVTLLALLWRYHHRHCAPDSQQSASMSLNTLAVPKRDSVSSDNNGSDRSDVVFPLRASDSMLCRHYERVSSDYGPPVYIVQEIPPQSPTNIYYKV